MWGSLIGLMLRCGCFVFGHYFRSTFSSNLATLERIEVGVCRDCGASKVLSARPLTTGEARIARLLGEANRESRLDESSSPEQGEA
jgi:hypothetical protein